MTLNLVYRHGVKSYEIVRKLLGSFTMVGL